MADVVVMGYRTQALAVPHHPNGLELLVWRQFWLGPEMSHVSWRQPVPHWHEQGCGFFHPQLRPKGMREYLFLAAW